MKNMYNSIDAIRTAIDTDATGLIEVSETAYYDELHRLAERVDPKAGRTVIAIAGPSGSGKTTTAKLLLGILARRGIRGEMISLDDFYRGVSKIPFDESGKQDFESVSALDLEYLHDCFAQLQESGICDLPVFDFGIGERASHTRRITLQTGGVAIIEGLHAINPALISAMEAPHIIKVFVNVDTRVFADDGRVAFTRRDLRLMRRASRDLIYRNSPLSNTLRMWPDVLKGEERYLFPHKCNADLVIDTFHPYEPAIFKDRILACIDELDREHPGFSYVAGIEQSLQDIPALPASVVPENSLLREFL